VDLKYDDWYEPFSHPNSPRHPDPHLIQFQRVRLTDSIAIFGDGPDGLSPPCDGYIFNGTESHVALFNQFSDLSSAQNYTGYDNLVRGSTPIILTAYRKMPAFPNFRWADTRLVCLGANDIASGSRVPNGGIAAAPLQCPQLCLSVAMAWVLLIAAV